jgi:hypothetical protein
MDDIDALRLEVAALRAELQHRTAAADTDQAERTSRRGILRLAGAAVVAGGAAAIGAARPASATTAAMMYGATNNAGDSQTDLVSTSDVFTFGVTNVGSANAAAIFASIDGTGQAVDGKVNFPSVGSSAVRGSCDGTLGYGLEGRGGAAQLYLSDPSFAAMPGAGAHKVGEIARGADGGFYACVATGTPGTWRTITGPAASGAFFAISPARVYDSRRTFPDNGAPLSSGQSRTVSVRDRRNLSDGAVAASDVVPAGATAIAYNITAINTLGGGYLTVNPGGVTTISAASVNWTDATNIGNASVVAVSANREVTVICGGGGAQAHFSIDVVGYYR